VRCSWPEVLFIILASVTFHQSQSSFTSLFPPLSLTTTSTFMAKGVSTQRLNLLCHPLIFVNSLKFNNPNRKSIRCHTCNEPFRARCVLTFAVQAGITRNQNSRRYYLGSKFQGVSQKYSPIVTGIYNTKANISIH